jgi:hypothetical protein
MGRPTAGQCRGCQEGDKKWIHARTSLSTALSFSCRFTKSPNWVLWAARRWMFDGGGVRVGEGGGRGRGDRNVRGTMSINPRKACKLLGASRPQQQPVHMRRLSPAPTHENSPREASQGSTVGGEGWGLLSAVVAVPKPDAGYPLLQSAQHKGVGDGTRACHATSSSPPPPLQEGIAPWPSTCNTVATRGEEAGPQTHQRARLRASPCAVSVRDTKREKKKKYTHP